MVKTDTSSSRGFTVLPIINCTGLYILLSLPSFNDDLQWKEAKRQRLIQTAIAAHKTSLASQCYTTSLSKVIGSLEKLLIRWNFVRIIKWGGGGIATFTDNLLRKM